MKKTTSIFLCIFFLIFIINLINGFKNEITFYALFHSEKYFIKECLVYDSKHLFPQGDCLGYGCYYYYEGYLRNNSQIKASVIAIYGNEGSFCSNRDLPVWYCKLSKEVLWRRFDVIDNPISWRMLDFFMNSLSTLLFLPTLFYFTYLRSSREGLKVVSLILSGLYFTFLIYEIVTDFTVIKSIYSHF